MEKSIIVPWDFTEKAFASFLHAKMLSSMVELPITLLHVVKKNSEIANIEPDLKSEAEQLEKEHAIKVMYHCMAGNLYKSIKKYSQTSEAPIVVMPFHNSKKAFKVISGSEIPFYLVRDVPATKSIDNIVVPVDHHEKSRVQLNWVIYLSKFFSSKVSIIYPVISSSSKKKLMQKNIFFAKQIMSSKDVEYTLQSTKEKMKFTEAINNFTEELNADLIFMMSYNLKEYMKFSDKTESSNLPIICLNPKSVKIVPDKY